MRLTPPSFESRVCAVTFYTDERACQTASDAAVAAKERAVLTAPKPTASLVIQPGRRASACGGELDSPNAHDYIASIVAAATAFAAAKLASVVDTTQDAATPSGSDLSGARPLPSVSPSAQSPTSPTDAPLSPSKGGRFSTWLRRATGARPTEERAGGSPDLKAEAAARREQRLNRFTSQRASSAKEEAAILAAKNNIELRAQPGPPGARPRLQRYDSLQDAANRIHGAPIRCSLRDSQSSQRSDS